MAKAGEWTKVAKFEDCKEIIYEKKYYNGRGVARISINRPQRLNALTSVGMQEIIDALWEAGRDNSIGVVILTGVGDTAFCTGGDVEWEQTWGTTRGPRATPSINDAILDCPKPVIAAVKGWCVGGGNHWAYCCDFTIAAHNAKFGQNGPRVGSPASGYIVSHLAKIMGHKRAREMWMLCRRYTAQEAYEMGLVNKVVPLERIDEEVDKWCQELLALSPTCLRILKASFNGEMEHIRHAASGYYHKLLAPDFDGSEEQREAQRAFLEKRLPDFSKFGMGKP